MRKLVEKFGSKAVLHLFFLVAIFTASLVMVPQVASATTYTSMDAMLTAIGNNTAVKYIDVVNFGTYNGNTLQWIYMGPNQDSSDTSAKTEPYFVMTKNSFQTTMNLLSVCNSDGFPNNWASTDLYHWLNGTFRSSNLNNDPRILEVTLPSSNDYSSRIGNEGSYSNFWWLRTFMPYNSGCIQRIRVVTSGGYTFTGTDGSIYSGNPSNNSGYVYDWFNGLVRPAFFIKSDYVPNDSITFNGTGTADTTVSGSTAVDIVCSQKNNIYGSGMYEWSTSSAKPSSGWTSFSGGHTTATQSIIATWYLHVSYTDVFGHETYVSKKYTITATPGGGWITDQDKRDIANATAATDAITSIKTNSITAVTQSTSAANNTTYNGQSAAYWAYQTYLATINSKVTIPPPVYTVIKGVAFNKIMYGELSSGTTTVNGITATVTATSSDGSGYTTFTGTLDTIGAVRIKFGDTTIMFNVIAAPTSSPATVSFSN